MEEDLLLDATAGILQQPAVELGPKVIVVLHARIHHLHTAS